MTVTLTRPPTTGVTTLGGDGGAGRTGKGAGRPGKGATQAVERAGGVGRVGARGRVGASGRWITATLRPAGSFGREDAARLSGLLAALSATVSMVVLDLQSARLRSRKVASVVEAAAVELECRGGCLLCVNADADTRQLLASAGRHLVIFDGSPQDLCAPGDANETWR